jgi:ribosome biogenesis GTPase A
MSEQLRPRNNLEHVPIEKGIPERADGGVKARSGAARPPQPQEIDPTICVPDMPQISPDQKVDNELMFTRGLLCGMIEQAVLDAQNETVYETKSLNEHREMNQKSAIAFLNSTFYSQLCTALGNASGFHIPAKRIRQKAMS